MSEALKRPKGISVTGAILTLLFSAGILAAWWATYTRYTSPEDQLSVPSRVEDALTDDDNLEGRIAIPTGVFVQSLQFEGATAVRVTGHVWQRIDAETQGMILALTGEPIEEFEWGVRFPEAIDGGISENPVAVTSVPLLNVEPPVPMMDGEEQPAAAPDTHVRVWSFEALLRQPFDYRDFPFDVKDVWIRFWPKTFDDRFCLAPDLRAYAETGVGDPFGLNKNVSLNGWSIQESYFDYKSHHYDSDFGFGLYDVDEPENATELYFNVILQRDFLNPFVQDMLPVMVILLLLFGVLMTIGPGKGDGALGFSFAGTLGTTAALFFVVILGHTHLRGETGGVGFVYMEWAYLLTYLTIGVVSLVAFISASGWGEEHLSDLHRSGYRIVKVAYWPVLSGVGLILTLFELPIQQGTSPDVATTSSGGSGFDSTAILFIIVFIMLALIARSLLLLSKRVENLAVIVGDMQKKEPPSPQIDPVDPEPRDDGPIDTFVG